MRRAEAPSAERMVLRARRLCRSSLRLRSGQRSSDPLRGSLVRQLKRDSSLQVLTGLRPEGQGCQDLPLGMTDPERLKVCPSGVKTPEVLDPFGTAEAVP